MIIARVVKNQIPLLFTHDESRAEEIAELLAEAVEYHYEHMSFFQFDNGEYDEA
jgi:hypothetical protein